MIELRAYVGEQGNKPFAEWLDGLDAQAAAEVTIALARMEQGNFSQVRGVGSGVFERKVDLGPGYRIYFGKDGDTLVILVGGGTKKRQQHDIAAAQECWTEYKRRKKRELQ
jgi:putative addiction module killer protein